MFIGFNFCSYCILKETFNITVADWTTVVWHELMTDSSKTGTHFKWKCNSLLCVEIVGCMLNNLHLLYSHLYPIFVCCILLFAALRTRFHLNLQTFIAVSNTILSNQRKLYMNFHMHTQSKRVSHCMFRVQVISLLCAIQPSCHSIMLSFQCTTTLCNRHQGC